MIPLHDQNPTRRFPFVTIALIVICVLAFLWQVGLGDRALHREILGLGAIPALLTGDARLPPELYQVPAAITLITSLFLHGGWFHLIGNMLYLWVFGNNIEDVLGHFRFTAFYLLCGVLATFAHVLNDPASQIPLIGASGAISGVLGAYIILYPHARVLTLIPIFIIFWTVRLPAWLLLAIWFGMQLFNAHAAGGGDGVAYWAHIGGFVAGIPLLFLFRPALFGTLLRRWAP